jgi:hypothetical protein
LTDDVVRTGGGKRRLRQNYFDMGFDAGDLVTFEGRSETATVASAHRLGWKGDVWSLTAVRRELGKRMGKKPFHGTILIDGRDLDVAYDLTYGKAGRAKPR